MKIETIKIQGFRCFGEPIEFKLENVLTTFVGGNGSGKTAALQALSRLFGTSTAQRSIRRQDFHIPINCQELKNGDCLSIEAVLTFPKILESDDNALKAVPEFFYQMVATAQGEPLKARIRLQATWMEDGTPEGVIEEDIRWIRTLDDDFNWDECIKVQAVERAAIQFIYLPANRDAATQVTSLLKSRLWLAAKWSEGFRQQSSRLANDAQAAFEQEPPSQALIDRLVSRWQQVHEADTDSTPRLKLIENRFDELIKKAEFTFSPDEAGKERPLSDLSDGQRSLFHIALTAATLEIEKEVFYSSADESQFEQNKLHHVHLTLLAIEEPENSLSPFFLPRIITQAREIGELPSAQILISSHSPAIMSRIEPSEVRYLRLDRKTRCSSIRAITLPIDDDEASRYVRLAVKAHPELYFARFVILGEGESERIIIQKIAENMGVHLDPSFVPVVPLGGRYVTHFWRLLTNLEIPYATLLDLDLGRKHGGREVIRTCLDNLGKIRANSCEHGQISNGQNPAESICLGNIEKLSDDELIHKEQSNEWFSELQQQGIFFSHPLDIDFAMLRAFPDAYKKTNPGGSGPQESPEAIQNKKNTILKTGGNPDIYGSKYDDTFNWYPYLFQNRSKPETHLAALSRIQDEDFCQRIPAELKDLINFIKRELGLSGEH